MTLVIPPTYGQATFLFRGPGSESTDTVITLGVKRETEVAAPDPTPQEMANRFRAAYETFHADRAVSAWVFEGVKLKYNNGGTMEDYEAMADVPGGSSATPLPPNIACLVKKTTNQAGRTGKGRFFIPGILTADVVNGSGIISPTAIVNIQAKLAVLYADLKRLPVSGSLDRNIATLHVLHNVTPNIPVPGPPSTITGFAVTSKIGTQRSRLR